MIYHAMPVSSAETQQILFLCTGNYYRSRTAEEVFNQYAADAGLSWRADSKGLRIDMENSPNPGPIAVAALSFLETQQILARGKDRFPVSVQTADFLSFDRIICLDQQEHLPMMESRFPLFAEEVEYWHFPDMPHSSPEEILPAIRDRVQRLVAELNEIG